LDGRVNSAEIVCAADPSQGEYFTIVSGSTTFGVWMDTAGDGSTGKPTVSGVAAGDLFAADISGGSTASEVATAIAAALNDEAEFTAWSNSENVGIQGASVSHALGACVDGDTGFTFTYGAGIRVWIQAGGANTETVAIVGINGAGNEYTESITLDGTTGVLPTTRLLRINGLIRSGVTANAVSLRPVFSLASPYAVAGSEDSATINCRFYVPSGRKAIMHVKASIRDVINTTAPANNNVNVFVQRGSDLVTTMKSKSVAPGQPPVEFLIDATGSATEYLTIAHAETDTDGTVMNTVLEQTIITYDT
jgi:hypothetical protein